MKFADPSRCLVIGASGFIGRNLVRRLADQGVHVRAISRSGQPLVLSDKVEWVAGDMSEDTLRRALVGCHACVQLATTTTPGSSNKDIGYDISSNLLDNVGLLRQLAQCNPMKLVFLSSGGAVYGDPVYTPIDENHHTDPKSSYGITKLAIEKYIRMFHAIDGLDATVLRVSNPFGEYQRVTSGQGVIAAFLAKIRNEEPIEIWGDGSAIRDFIYVGDVCDAIITALGYTGTASVFNIGYGKGLSIIGILREIEKVLGTSADVRFLPGRLTDVHTSVLDISLAQKELEWSPKTSFIEGLHRTVEWLADEDEVALSRLGNSQKAFAR